MRFDHAIIAAFDLEAATRDFEDLGFNVVYGGAHEGGLTHNGLISFADGTYLEIMAPTDPDLLGNPPDSEPGNYLFLFHAGEGFAGFALHTDDLEAVVERLRKRGIEIDDPASGGRQRTDGVQLSWRSAFPLGSQSPFFMTDETPRELRVRMEADIITHPNGASGISRLLSVVPELEEGIARYSSFLDTDPEVNLESETAKAVFRLGALEVAISEPVAQDRAMAEHLELRGQGLFEIVIRSNQGASVRARGARIELERV